MRTLRPPLRAAAALACAAALAACGGARKKDAAGAPGAAAAASASEPRIEGSQFVATPELQPIRFPYDRDTLGEAARATLKANASAIEANRGWEVLVEGHCDERGTVPYNLALGQRRAKAVRDYYMALGVPGGRVATISYGKERPECVESTEACWERNRRALSKVKSSIAVRPGAPKRHE